MPARGILRLTSCNLRATNPCSECAVPTILSHPAVPLAIGLGLGSRIISRRLLLAGVAASIIPDIDVYLEQITSSIGHRGHTHTLLFALLGAACAAAIARSLRAPPLTAFWFIAIAAASHGLLDAFTTGGGGISFFWPLTDQTYFMPWRVIEVAPMGVRPFFSERGVTVILSVLKWIWLPAVTVALALYTLRRSRAAAAH